jgi:hypothetical protein
MNLEVSAMYTAERQSGSSGQAFVTQRVSLTQVNPVRQASEIFHDWTNRNWTAMMSKLDQDAKSALKNPNGINLFREEIKQLNGMLRNCGFGWYILDVCHDQHGLPGIITSQDGQHLLWKSLSDLQFNQMGKWVRWDGLRWAPLN